MITMKRQIKNAADIALTFLGDSDFEIVSTRDHHATADPCGDALVGCPTSELHRADGSHYIKHNQHNAVSFLERCQIVSISREYAR
ncbi:Unannotated [Lentimonas sp. CC19]|nr:Unannotated [Lentimonas sp. CC4]CAA6684969.1 Unannotated [Lentimonas sp. CC6]CAA6691747.1 Unannotated [Lentimonas sp. CC19]CAA6696118.1 Unannotated [Lentimonas sp. CC10]CAA7070098.1 Unannotated [Lentimonas sp. CC11]CAA7169840.1 Unannotated [Lentimonas sp. CC21]CAA7179959.1 Unannotated [Lentimonas sp. CC8]